MVEFCFRFMQAKWLRNMELNFLRFKVAEPDNKYKAITWSHNVIVKNFDETIFLMISLFPRHYFISVYGLSFQILLIRNLTNFRSVIHFYTP